MGTGLLIEHKTDRHYGRWVLMFIVLALITVFCWYTYQWYMTGMRPPVPIPVAKADSRINEEPVAAAAVDDYKVPASNPRYISIASLNVGKTRVYPVGVTDQNVLDTPRNIHDAAWYKKSVTPGNGFGAVLINAHNGGNTKDGVFAKLSTLQPNDEIIVERGDGKTFAYKVVENQIMSLDEVNKTGMKMMMTSADPAKEGLNLITCAGKWIPRLGQFDQRVMLRAVAVDIAPTDSGS